MIDAVLFDLGNTLVAYYKAHEFHPILERCVESVAAEMRRHGRSVDVQSANAHARALNRESPDGRVRPLEGRLLEIFGGANRDLPSHLLDRLSEAFLAPVFATARIDPAAVPVLQRLKALGLKTAIVSNTPWGSSAKAWRNELDRLGLLDNLDEVAFCVDVGWRKPHRAVFDYALQRLGVRASRALFVGDDAKWDIEGARRAGLIPVLLTQDAEPQPDCYRIRSLEELESLIANLGHGDR
ncbi:MAG TPA: HAD family hydrolase [Gammaproteobacteria bacterium]|jgi:HAD superfamily hydrolase (TIGR01509 family)|nr:HAD family hydrolase [Gammaproteobacteria bacterium]